MRSHGFHGFRWAALLLALPAAGCFTVGARAVRPIQSQFNATIAQTLDEQLLLNLVRIRYRENPYFLQVGSVTSQLTLSANGGLGADVTIGGGATGNTALHTNLGLNWTVMPTVVYAPLQGREFAESLLKAVPLEVLLHLMESGWQVDRLLRVMVNRINFLANAPEAAGPMPPEHPVFQEFQDVADRLQRLHADHRLVVDAVTVEKAPAPPAPAVSGEANEAPPAAKDAAKDKAGKDEASPRLIRVLLIRCRPNRLPDDDDVLTGLFPSPLQCGPSDDPDRGQFLQYRLETVPFTHDQPSRADALPSTWKAPKNTIFVHMRSVLSVMFYLAQAIAVPREDVAAGRVTQTMAPTNRPDWDALYHDLFFVASSDREPERAYVKVHYRGHWFYIAADDNHSKATFMLLLQLFNFQAGGAGAVFPSLTLPVGR